MLDQLVESKSRREEEMRRGRFFAAAMFMVSVLILGTWTYSLFAANFDMGDESLDLSRLVIPVLTTADAPPPVEMKVKPQNTVANDQPPEKVVLREFYEDPTKPRTPPAEIGGQRNIINAEQFDLRSLQRGAVDSVPNFAGRREVTDGDAKQGVAAQSRPRDDDENEKPPQITVPEPKPSPTLPLTRSEGVINGKATYLAQPPYLQAAKILRIGGTVNVQVTIDESGNVISAAAVSGPALLRQVSEQAARASKFSPTYLSRQPIRVTGIIVYNFKLP